MRLTSLVAAMAVVASLAPIASQAQSSSENPWMLRVRAVDVLFQNGQTQTVQTANVKAQNLVIPEFDVSYFFTKNIAVGMDYMFDKNWGLNVDVKYITMATDVTLNGANIGKLTLNPWTPGVGVTYKF